MTEKTLKILEYKRILEFLEEEAGSELTRNHIRNLIPFNEESKIIAAQKETTEGVKLILYKGALPLGNFYDINGSIILAKKGGVLSPKQLLEIYYNLMITRKTKKFMEEDIPELDIIKLLVFSLYEHKKVEEEIDRCILSEDEISDNASIELRNIRRTKTRKNEEIRSKLSNLISSTESRALLQDNIVTLREGRYVIPVKTEHTAKFPGIIHDQSSKGSTVFIEPQAVVILNNQLRELEQKEKEEIHRILEELSTRISEIAAELQPNLDILRHLDFIMAKARLSRKFKCEEPSIGDEDVIDLKNARHPFIPNDKVVPTNIKLGKKYSTLIITGPNTGGKTVSLKTVGLLTLMAQTGLHITAEEGSKIRVFDNIYADIGDEQSIEQSLSTFSSHMKNIIEIVKVCDYNSLVLLDELGAGTDPMEGAALAISILNNLFKKKSLVMATTHYTEIKKYALSTNGVENASMQFDVETLSPTYKLTIGIPGKSNAFDISEKLGLESSIIHEARHLLTTDALKFEDVVSAIEEDKKKAEIERDEAITINIAMKKKEDEAKLKLDKAILEREKILNKAKEEARSIIDEAKIISKEVQEELKELNRIESLGERTKKLDESKKRIKDAAGKYREKIIKEINDNPISLENVKIGDKVKVITLNQNGEVIEMPNNKGEIIVQIGNMKAKVNFEDLKLINQGTPKKKNTYNKSSYSSIYKSKTQNISPTINVQGQRLEDALENVAKYLDDAFIAEIPSVTIIHGRGEGILKKGIHDLLKKKKDIKKFRLGEYNEGGEGVTVVKF